jgi:predicted transcriptional regulator
MTEITSQALSLTAQIVSAYLRANAVADADLPSLIRNTHRSLMDMRQEAPAAQEPSRSGSEPAVEVRKSVFPDHLVCLEDGSSVTMLKRHPMTAHGLTPDQYRTKWSLPGHYPMVAPNYAKVRSKLAKQTGLGRKRR